MALGKRDAWGDSGHEIGHLSHAFDKRPPKGDSILIDGRPLSVKLPREGARQPTIEPAPSKDAPSTPRLPRKKATCAASFYHHVSCPT